MPAQPSFRHDYVVLILSDGCLVCWLCWTDGYLAKVRIRWPRQNTTSVYQSQAHDCAVEHKHDWITTFCHNTKQNCSCVEERLPRSITNQNYFEVMGTWENLLIVVLVNGCHHPGYHMNFDKTSSECETSRQRRPRYSTNCVQRRSENKNTTSQLFFVMVHFFSWLFLPSVCGKLSV